MDVAVDERHNAADHNPLNVGVSVRAIGDRFLRGESTHARKCL
jgi:hypothetical protein